MIEWCAKIDKLISSKKDSDLTADFSFRIFRKVEDIPLSEWERVRSNAHFFLSLPYLGATEKTLTAPHLHFCYALVYNLNQPALIAVFQINQLPANIFSELAQQQFAVLKSRKIKLIERYLDHKKNETVLTLITCGNNIISGQNAFVYNELLTKDQASFALQMVIKEVSREQKLRGKISANLIKDFNRNHPEELPVLDKKFISFSVEPNLVVRIKNAPASIQEYIQQFSKKYRNRAKGILKKGEVLTRKNLSLAEIGNVQQTLFELYEKVFNRSKFKLLKLSPNYFWEMKRAFPEHFFVNAYFFEHELIAFSSGFILPDRIEAHYVGFDSEKNERFECYQNLLYDFISTAITCGKEIVFLGRTAAEIKSTVGAVAEDLICFIKPQNNISKLIINSFIDYLKPVEWTPRHPFKD